MIQLRYLIAPFFAGLLTVIGCHKPKESAPAPARPSKSTGISVESLTDGHKETTAPAAADGGVTDAASHTLSSTSGDSKLPDPQTLFVACEKFIEKHGRYPADADELVSKGFLHPLPVPAAGKKYKLDVRGATLEQVDK